MNKTSKFSIVILSASLSIVFISLVLWRVITDQKSGWGYTLEIGGLIISFIFLFQSIILHDLKIQNSELLNISLFSTKKIRIEKIEIVTIKIGRGPSFCINIRDSEFNIAYTKQNYLILKDLISKCKKSSITVEQLDEKVRTHFFSLK